MLVTIVTVCLNSAKTIQRTVESVLCQTYRHIEYIIVDGASTDGTLEIIEGFKSRFASTGIAMIVTSEKDCGIYEAMNKGILCASGEIIGIINSDDWYEPDAVQKVVERYVADPFDYLHASIRCHRKDGRSFTKKSRLSNYITTRYWNHPSSFLARGVYAERLYQLECLYDDFELYVWVRRSGKKVAVLNTVLAHFSSGGPSNGKDPANILNRVREKYRIYRKHGYSRLYLLDLLLTEAGKFLLQ
jgi:glycosyltransferase involved in cell wall biosynthesis